MRERLEKIRAGVERWRPRLKMFGLDALLDDLVALLDDIVRELELRR